MPHTHDVVDTDPFFTISPDTRTITNLSKTKAVLIQLDHNSECFTFKLPRVIDGHDMLLCNSVRVHYINIGGQDRNEGVYLITDLKKLDDDPEYITCSWTISQNATMYAGTLNFALEFACAEDGEITYVWNTAIYKDVIVSPGIHNDAEESMEMYPDTIQKIQDEMGDIDAALDSIITIQNALMGGDRA